MWTVLLKNAYYYHHRVSFAEFDVISISNKTNPRSHCEVFIPSNALLPGGTKTTRSSKRNLEIRSLNRNALVLIWHSKKTPLVPLGLESYTRNPVGIGQSDAPRNSQHIIGEKEIFVYRRTYEEIGSRS